MKTLWLMIFSLPVWAESPESLVEPIIPSKEERRHLELVRAIERSSEPQVIIVPAGPVAESFEMKSLREQCNSNLERVLRKNGSPSLNCPPELISPP